MANTSNYQCGFSRGRGHPLEGVSPSMFPYLKRTHTSTRNPLCQRTLLLMGNVREHIRIGRSWPRVGITNSGSSRGGQIPQMYKQKFNDTCLHYTTKTLNPKNLKPLNNQSKGQQHSLTMSNICEIGISLARYEKTLH